MPSLIDIRRRIRSVRNTQQITRAMKMVSAAKLRRAQDRVIASRPYGAALRGLLADVAAAAASDERVAAQPLLARRPERHVQLILITSDKGLAGAFNSNLIKAAQRFAEEHKPAATDFVLIGRKGRDFFRRRHGHITGEYSTIFQKVVRFEDALEIARKVTDRFRKGEIDAVYLVVNNFKSMMSSNLVTARILPVEIPAKEKQEQIDYIYEQPPGELLQGLVPRYIEAQIYRALLESAAAEHAARMTAMEAASSNAAEVIDALTLKMNRVRQASITREIIEIVSGAAALD